MSSSKHANPSTSTNPPPPSEAAAGASSSRLPPSPIPISSNHANPSASTNPPPPPMAATGGTPSPIPVRVRSSSNHANPLTLRNPPPPSMAAAGPFPVRFRAPYPRVPTMINCRHPPPPPPSRPLVRTNSPTVLELAADPNTIYRRLPSPAVARMYGYRMPFYHHSPSPVRQPPRTSAPMAAARQPSNPSPNQSPNLGVGQMRPRMMTEPWRRDLEARTLQFIPLPASTKRRADFDLPVTVKTEPETSDQNVPVRPPGFSGPRLVNSAVNAIGEAWLRKKGHFPSYGGSSSSPQVDHVLNNIVQALKPGPVVIREPNQRGPVVIREPTHQRPVVIRESNQINTNNPLLQFVPHHGRGNNNDNDYDSSNLPQDAIFISDEEDVNFSGGDSTDSEATISIDPQVLYRKKDKGIKIEEEVTSRDTSYEGGIHSLNHPKHGPYQCPKCESVFDTSQKFATHVSKHYKLESKEERRRRRLARRKLPKLQVIKTSYGITIGRADKLPLWSQELQPAVPGHDQSHEVTFAMFRVPVESQQVQNQEPPFAVPVGNQNREATLAMFRVPVGNQQGHAQELAGLTRVLPVAEAMVYGGGGGSVDQGQALVLAQVKEEMEHI